MVLHVLHFLKRAKPSANLCARQLSVLIRTHESLHTKRGRGRPSTHRCRRHRRAALPVSGRLFPRGLI